MDWWRKLTVGGPGSMSAWFWQRAQILLIEKPAEWLRWRMLWRCGLFVLTVAIAAALVQDFGPELALLTAVDTTTFLEVFSIVALIAARGHARQILRLAADAARRAAAGSARMLALAVQRLADLRHRRAIGIVSSRRAAIPAKKAEDDPAWAWRAPA